METSTMAIQNGRKTCITTSLLQKEETKEAALHMSEALEVEYLKRGTASIKDIFEEGYEAIVVCKPEKIIVLNKTEDGSLNEFFFHPGLAMMRIKRMEAKGEDLMVKAMSLKRGDKVLDCTMGMATDAIVASWVIGEEGSLVALESCKLIFEVVKHGLANLRESSSSLTRVFSRIQPVFANYRDFLFECLEGEYDVIYFDPMFTVPNMKSAGINPLRAWADKSAIDTSSFDRALNVARKSVVVKDDVSYGFSLKRLNIKNCVKSRRGFFQYGYLHKNLNSSD